MCGLPRQLVLFFRQTDAIRHEMDNVMKLSLRFLLRLLPKTRWGDTLYHGVLFFVAHRRLPRRNSGLFNDYLFFLKNARDFDSAHRQFVSDKSLVKTYYRGVLGEDLAPRTLAKFRSMREFVEAELPAPCIIKPAHLSGGIYYASSVDSLPVEILAQVAAWFRTNIYYDISRERNYRSLVPSVICEELISSPDAVRDYKIFCFKGFPRAIQVDVDRHSKHKRRMYTADWQALPYMYNKPLADVEPVPPRLGEALMLARKLAREFEFVRVDVYLSEQRVWLGEMTSVPENAHGRFGSLEDEIAFSELVFSPGSGQ